MSEDLQEILSKFKENPHLWWELLDNFPVIYGPWTRNDCKGVSNLRESWVRRNPGGRVMATVMFYIPGFRIIADYKQAGGWMTALRSEENPEWGMVDFKHKAETAEEGMRLVDEELRRRGVLLVD